MNDGRVRHEHGLELRAALDELHTRRQTLDAAHAALLATTKQALDALSAHARDCHDEGEQLPHELIRELYWRTSLPVRRIATAIAVDATHLHKLAGTVARTQPCPECAAPVTRVIRSRAHLHDDGESMWRGRAAWTCPTCRARIETERADEWDAWARRCAREGAEEDRERQRLIRELEERGEFEESVVRWHPSVGEWTPEG